MTLGDARDRDALLLDMNSTFVFGEDRFGPTEHFAAHYATLGGGLSPEDADALIRAAFDHLAERYPDPAYRDAFPSVAAALRDVSNDRLDDREIERLVATFAHHECGSIPDDYARALHDLGRRFTLAAVVDIWAPKETWLRLFEGAGIVDLFAAMSFSSDHGIVKPSPEPFRRVLEALGIAPDAALMIGDSARRDLGGARAAGVDCVLVGGATHPDAIACCSSLLDFRDAVLDGADRGARAR